MPSLTHNEINGKEIEIDNGRKINIKVLDALIHEILEKNAEEWFKEEINERNPSLTIPLSTADVQTELYQRYDMDISTETVRRNGFSKGGVLERTYDYLEYNKTGDPKYWGMKLDILEYFKQEGKLEELIDKHKDSDDINSNTPEGYDY